MVKIHNKKYVPERYFAVVNFFLCLINWYLHYQILKTYYHEKKSNFNLTDLFLFARHVPVIRLWGRWLH